MTLQLQSTTDSAPRGRWDRILLRIILGVSVLVAAGLACIAVLNVIRIATNTSINLTLPAQVPLPASATSGTLTLLSGGLSEARIVVSGLGPDALAFVTSGAVLTWAMYLSVAGIWIGFLARVLRGRPFARAVRVSLLICAGVVAVVGLAGETLTSLGTALAAVQLTGHGDLDPFEISAVPGLEPLVAAAVLAVAALVVKSGESMQSDVESLV